MFTNWGYLLLNNMEYWKFSLAASCEAIRLKLMNLNWQTVTLANGMDLHLTSLELSKFEEQFVQLQQGSDIILKIFGDSAYFDNDQTYLLYIKHIFIKSLIHSSIHLSLSIHLSIYLSIYPSIRMSFLSSHQQFLHIAYLGIHPSIHPSIHLFIFIFIPLELQI